MNELLRFWFRFWIGRFFEFSWWGECGLFELLFIFLFRKVVFRLEDGSLRCEGFDSLGFFFFGIIVGRVVCFKFIKGGDVIGFFFFVLAILFLVFDIEKRFILFVVVVIWKRLILVDCLVFDFVVKRGVLWVLFGIFEEMLWMVTLLGFGFIRVFFGLLFDSIEDFEVLDLKWIDFVFFDLFWFFFWVLFIVIEIWWEEIKVRLKNKVFNV